MSPRLLTIIGTGTDVGKTFVTAALVSALRHEGAHVGAWKPIASGVTPGETPADSRILAAALGAPVAPPLHAFTPPLSPHLAARRAGLTIALQPLLERARALAAGHDIFLLETAGGLFSPLAPGLTNVDLVIELGASAVLVAPDRIGVLHDVSATWLAARLCGLTPDLLVLSDPDVADPSTGTNADELRELLGVTVAGVFARSTVDSAISRLTARKVLSSLGL